MKPFFKILIYFIFSTTLLNAQSSIDSLTSILESDIHDTIRLNTLYQLSSELSKNDFDQSLLYAEKLFEISTKLNNDTKLAQAYILMGTAYFNKDYQIDTVLKFSQEGLKVAERTNDLAIKNDILRNIALAYQKSGQLNKAFVIFQEIITTSQEAGLMPQVIRGFSNIALIPYYQKDFRKAQSYFLKGLEIAEKTNHKEYTALLSNNIAEIYKELNVLDSALVFYKRSVAMNKELDNKPRVALTLSNIGNTYAKLGKYILANKYLRNGYELAKENNYSRVLSINRYYLTQSYFDQEKHEQSIKAGEEGLVFLGENGHVTRRKEYYKLLSLNHEEIGNYKAALDYRKQFQVLNDSIFNLNKNEQIQSLEIEYEVKQKEIENKQLKEKQEIAQKTIKNRTFAAIGLILALLSAIGWGVFINRSNQQKKKLNESLEAKVKERTEELESANYNLAQANNDLRTLNFIASHDIKEPIRNIGNYAGFIFRKLPSDLKENLGEYFDTIKNSTSQLYTLIEDFTRYNTMARDEDVAKDNVDLSLLLNTIKSGLEETIQEKNGQIITNDLPTIYSSSSLLFATLRNLIKNGLIYNESAQPTVNVNYNDTDTHHEILVSDNGIGIEEEYYDKIFEIFKRLHNRSEYQGTGLGLAIVKLSIDKLKGSIQVSSEKEKGTTFILRFPK